MQWHITDHTWPHFCEHIGRMRLAGKRPVVEIRPERRSIDQNSISHAWYTQIANHRGDVSTLDVKCEAKLQLGVPILRAEDDSFREFYDSAIKLHLDYEQKLQAMKFLPVTSLMSKKQLSQYLEAMIQHYAREGIYLTFPEDAAIDYPEARRA